jgi:hypothetical protein
MVSYPEGMCEDFRMLILQIEIAQLLQGHATIERLLRKILAYV